MITLIDSLSTVSTIIKVSKKYKLHIVIPILIVVISFVYLINSRNAYIKKYELSQVNYVAAKDTLKTYKDKNGMMTTTIAAYSLTTKQLKKSNDSLFALYTKELKNPKFIEKIVVKYIRDTIVITNDDTTEIGLNGNVSLTFDYKKDDADLSFKAIPSFTVNPESNTITNQKLKVEDLQIGMNIITGIDVDEKTGKNTIFVKSSNPYVVIDTVFGNVLPDKNKPKFWDYFGIAVGPTVSYDFIDKDFSAGVGATGGFLFKRRK